MDLWKMNKQLYIKEEEEGRRVEEENESETNTRSGGRRCIKGEGGKGYEGKGERANHQVRRKYL